MWKAEHKANGKKFTEPAPKMMKNKEWVENYWQGEADDDETPSGDDDDAYDI